MGQSFVRTARSAVVGAPVGGWNARDPLPAMKPTDAVVLENMIPAPEGIVLRGGYEDWATGLPGRVSGLLRFNAAGQQARLFACAGNAIYDVTQQRVVGAPAVSGLTSDAWRGAMFGTPGGSFLVAANGADAPRKFDGAIWTEISLVPPVEATYGSDADPVPYTYPYGIDPLRLRSPVVFAQRIWFIERGTCRLWFLPVNSVGSSAQIPPVAGGAVPDISVCAQCLDLASQFRLGGSIAAMAIWTRDGGTGSDDYAVFISTAGEALIYAGTDPTSATAWRRVGLFRMSPPIGTACVMQAGADVAVLTETGVLPLSSILALTPAQDEQVAVTDKIRGAFSQAYAEAGTAFGWELAEYPLGGLLLVNVPSGDGTARQFVFNAITAGWCCFTGLPATVWDLLGDWPMYGTSDGRVCRYDVQGGDNGQPIRFTVQPAYRNFGSTGRKRFTMARALYSSVFGYRAPVKMMVDYDTSRPDIETPTPPAMLSTPWFSPWFSPWGPRQAVSATWRGVRGIGRVATPFVTGASLYPFRVDQIDVQLEPMGDLL